MNATRNRKLMKRYPKRIESEMMFNIYMKSFLKELLISC